MLKDYSFVQPVHSNYSSRLYIYMCQVGLFILPKWMFLWNTRKLDYLKLSCLYIPSFEFVVNNVYCIFFAINYNPIWFIELFCVLYETSWLKLKRQVSCLLYFYKQKRYFLVSEQIWIILLFVPRTTFILFNLFQSTIKIITLLIIHWV